MPHACPKRRHCFCRAGRARVVLKHPRRSLHVFAKERLSQPHALLRVARLAKETEEALGLPLSSLRRDHRSVGRRSRATCPGSRRQRHGSGGPEGGTLRARRVCRPRARTNGCATVDATGTPASTSHLAFGGNKYSTVLFSEGPVSSRVSVNLILGTLRCSLGLFLDFAVRGVMMGYFSAFFVSSTFTSALSPTIDSIVTYSAAYCKGAYCQGATSMTAASRS